MRKSHFAAHARRQSSSFDLCNLDRKKGRKGREGASWHGPKMYLTFMHSAPRNSSYGAYSKRTVCSLIYTPQHKLGGHSGPKLDNKWNKRCTSGRNKGREKPRTELPVERHKRHRTTTVVPIVRAVEAVTVEGTFVATFLTERPVERIMLLLTAAVSLALVSLASAQCELMRECIRAR